MSGLGCCIRSVPNPRWFTSIICRDLARDGFALIHIHQGLTATAVPSIPPDMPSITELKEAIAIAEKIQSLEAELSIIIVGSSPIASTPASASSAPAKRGGKRTMSPEARARMAASQKARWAKIRPTTTAPAKAPKKGGLSPEGRARIVAALKARHAAAKLAKNGR